MCDWWLGFICLTAAHSTGARPAETRRTSGSRSALCQRNESNAPQRRPGIQVNVGRYMLHCILSAYSSDGLWCNVGAVHSHCCLSVFQVAPPPPPAGHSARLSEEETTQESVFTGKLRGDAHYLMVIQTVTGRIRLIFGNDTCCVLSSRKTGFILFFNVCKIKCLFNSVTTCWIKLLCL